MVNKNKVKGTNWEHLLVELLESNIQLATAKRIPSSGALGTILGEPILQGDVVAKFYGLPWQMKFDAKVGYGGEKQLAFKREWLTKIRQEAERTQSIPAIACKFLGAKKVDGPQYFIALDFSAFCDIMNYVAKLEKEVERLLEKNE